MKTKFIIFLSLICFMANSQPVMIKQYDGKGSCLTIDEIYINVKKQSTLVRIGVYENYSTMRSGENFTAALDYNVPKIISNLDSIIDWLKNSHVDNDFYSNIDVTQYDRLPAAPDTTWINVSACVFDTTIHRKIGIYAIPDDPKGKQCHVYGVAKHYRNSELLPQYTQKIEWMVDNVDSIHDPNLGWVHTYDYLKGAKAAYGWNDDQLIQFGVSFFDPIKINDRLKY